MRISTLFVIVGLVLFSGCKTEDPLDFAPPIDPNATYSFSLTDPTGSGTTVYTVTGLTQQATQREGSGDNMFYTFMLKGKEKATQADVYITGNTNTYDSYLNIAIGQGTSTTFYKDCNNFNCQLDNGSDSRGAFIRLSNFTSQCVTTTLASERSMTIVQYNAKLNPLTFYIQ